MEYALSIYLLSLAINLRYMNLLMRNSKAITNRELAIAIKGSFVPVMNTITAVVIVFLELSDYFGQHTIKWYEE